MSIFALPFSMGDLGKSLMDLKGTALLLGYIPSSLFGPA
jgi:hypothetical protein